jgi:nicotinate-nucleotide adenylyltransferase
MKDKIALFGGSFNPPHKGHFQVVQYLSKLPEFKEIWLIPSFNHPYQKELIKFKHREEMCHLMISELKPKVSVCPVEAKLQLNPSYTIDTVLQLKKENNNKDFTWVLGSDSNQDVKNWKDYGKLAREVDFFPLPRAGYEESPFFDTSSQEIRKLIRTNQTWEHLVHGLVVPYIKRHQLYE